jgi:hypothetical protein
VLREEEGVSRRRLTHPAKSSGIVHRQAGFPWPGSQVPPQTGGDIGARTRASGGPGRRGRSHRERQARGFRRRETTLPSSASATCRCRRRRARQAVCAETEAGTSPAKLSKPELPSSKRCRSRRRRRPVTPPTPR